MLASVSSKKLDAVISGQSNGQLVASGSATDERGRFVNSEPGALTDPGVQQLFSPITIGRLRLKNRIVSPPHGTYFASDGLPTNTQIAYYEARARGGVGLIVGGSWAAWPRSMVSASVNLAINPRAQAGHRELAAAVHRHGCYIVAQLHDGGRQGSSSWHRGTLLAPSPLPDPVVREIPKELEIHEIEDMIKHFGLSAAAMQSAGWDGVEVFAAQGYGLSQFLSPQTNRRLDEFGGSLENRARVLLRIVAEIRSVVGQDFLVGVRINGADLIDGGLTTADGIGIAQSLEQAGGVDYLSVSGASNENYPLWIADMAHPKGLFVPLAAGIRQAVSLPVLVVTRITDPLHAESILREGDADLIGMNRALIADPDLPNKAREGRFYDIRPCIGCNQGCIGRVVLHSPMECTVNPRVGHEETEVSLDATIPRRVVVVGGGPAGLQASVTAAERGHEVVLFEEHHHLGGQLSMAAQTRSRSELGLIVEHLAGQASRLGVKVRLGEVATKFAIQEQQPEAVILATGSTPLRTGFSSFRPSVDAIPGHSLPHVMTAWDAFRDAESVGRSVVVVDDDPHGQATTVAEYLADAGREVTLVCRSMVVGMWGGPANQEFLYKRLFSAGVKLLTTTWVDEIAASHVRCYNVYSGQAFVVDDVDTIILATGNQVRDDLYLQLLDLPPVVKVSRVGDCLAPRRLDDAIREAHLSARSI